MSQREEELQREVDRLKQDARRRDEEAFSVVFKKLDGLGQCIGEIKLTCAERCKHAEDCMRGVSEDVVRLKNVVYGDPGTEHKGLDMRVGQVEEAQRRISAAKARAWYLAMIALVTAACALGKEWIKAHVFGHGS